MDKEKREQQVKLLQNNLSSIRKIAGWTAEELGDLIGVTKQTISNLENKKTPMTVTQYIALRSVIDYEIQTNKDNTVLPQVVAILLDNDNKLNREEQDKAEEAVKVVAASASGGMAGAGLATLFMTLIGGAVLGGPIGMIAGGATGISLWLTKILNNDDNDNEKEE